MDRSSEPQTQVRSCAEHGDYQATHMFGNHWTRCPECNQVIERRRQEQLQEREAKEQQAIRSHLLKVSGIGERYLAASFAASTAAQRRAEAACRAFVEDFKPDQGAGLFLLGPPGTGKTLLASTIVREIIGRYTLSAEIASARTIVRRLRATWARGADETEAAAIEDLAGLGLLVIDEIGTTTDAEVAQLFEVIDGRYQRRAPTIVCSNFTPALLQQALGDRSFDRLREGAVTVLCDWPSYRAQDART